METTVDEIADRIYRIATFVPGVLGRGLGFNQFVIAGDEALLFHTGPRLLFASIRSAVERLMPLERVRWIGLSHVEADECGALDLWLSACPRAEVVHGQVGCQTWLRDTSSRPPRALADGEVLDLGGKRARHLDTPHVPHGWDAGLLFEETTATLFTSDLLATLGDGPAIAKEDLLGPAIATEDAFERLGGVPPTNLGVRLVPTLRRLAALTPTTLAVMHGSSTDVRAAATLEALAAHFDDKIRTTGAV